MTLPAKSCQKKRRHPGGGCRRFYRLQGGESLWFRSKAVGGGSVKLNSGLFAECGLVSDALDRGPMNAKIGQLAAC